MMDLENVPATEMPVFGAETLQAMSPQELIEALLAHDDRVPRNLIDACASRGSDMVEALRQRLDFPWENISTDGEWWLRLHGCMILGLIPDEGAGNLLTEWMRRMALAEETDLQDWLAGDWPALYANKPDTVQAGLRKLAGDRPVLWYGRIFAVESVLAMAGRVDAQALEQALEWAAAMAADPEEDWDMRRSVASTLLDFPRPSYRPLLEDLARQQSGWVAFFVLPDVEAAYAKGQDSPRWQERNNPWSFYDAEAIRARQLRWEEDEARAVLDQEDDFDEDIVALPYVRDEPKVGRNDPCPCGSGMKYKKCCLDKPAFLPPMTGMLPDN